MGQTSLLNKSKLPMKQTQRKVRKRRATMNISSFNPLEFIEQYKLASQNESEKIKKRKQSEAEAIAKAIQESQDDILDSFTTKNDLKLVEVKLENKIDLLEQRMIGKIAVTDGKIAKMAITIIASMTGIMAIFCGILFFLLRFS